MNVILVVALARILTDPIEIEKRRARLRMYASKHYQRVKSKGSPRTYANGYRYCRKCGVFNPPPIVFRCRECNMPIRQSPRHKGRKL